MTDLKIVAHMMCRNEVDVIEETVVEILRWVDTLIVLDGESDDGTWSLLCDVAEAQAALTGKLVELHQEPDPEHRHTGHLRNRLLELTAPHDPDWVISIDADEIYHVAPDTGCGSPLDAIRIAQAQGANVVRCHVPQFWLTFDDLSRGLVEDESVSVQKRRRWYTWGHMVTPIWRWNPEHFYPLDVSKRTPEIRDLDWGQWQKAGPACPVLKHYCFRSLRQALQRAEERLERWGRAEFGKYALNYIIDQRAARLHYLGSKEVWQVNRNEHRVYAYMDPARTQNWPQRGDFDGILGDGS